MVILILHLRPRANYILYVVEEEENYTQTDAEKAEDKREQKALTKFEEEKNNFYIMNALTCKTNNVVSSASLADVSNLTSVHSSSSESSSKKKKTQVAKPGGNLIMCLLMCFITLCYHYCSYFLNYLFFFWANLFCRSPRA